MKHVGILRELQKMFAYLQESEHKAYNPRSFCKIYVMDKQPLNTGEQKDMTEFFTDLISKMEEMSPALVSGHELLCFCVVTVLLLYSLVLCPILLWCLWQPRHITSQLWCWWQPHYVINQLWCWWQPQHLLGQLLSDEVHTVFFFFLQKDVVRNLFHGVITNNVVSLVSCSVVL